jgi:hypothetical protein
MPVYRAGSNPAIVEAPVDVVPRPSYRGAVEVDDEGGAT